MSTTQNLAYEWRGFMLDCVRHFMPISFLKEVIDHMEKYKMNRFHWHLTDDQGWRLPVKKRPLLIEKASHRIDGDHFIGGYYSEEQIKDFVAYAAKKGITVIPEIDLPGHICAALYAYPELSCPGHEMRIPNTWGVFEDVLCAASPDTSQFLMDVFESVLELFPSPWIHIGGDEVKEDRWKCCKSCQHVIKENNYPSEKSLYSHILKPVCDYLRKNGRTVIGWDEMLEACPDEDMVIMSWRGEEGAIEAAKQGKKSILCPHEYFYLDYPEKEDDPIPGADWMPTLPIEKIRAYQAPKIDGILGLQCNLWVEELVGPDEARHRLLPRLEAVAEKCQNKVK